MGFKNLMRKLGKVNSIIRTYPFAQKKKGYGLRITGDIDSPDDFGELLKTGVLKEWINLASALSTDTPILFVTITSPNKFEWMKNTIREIDRDVIIGVHGYHHIHYPRTIGLGLLPSCSRFGVWFRFPYLDVNLTFIHGISPFFQYDSSLTSSTLYPFKIGEMWEYPITPPTDTALRNNPLTDKVIDVYLTKIADGIKRARAVTFLFHPNRFSLDLMKKLEPLVT